MIRVVRKPPNIKNRDVWQKTNGHCWYCGARLLKPGDHHTPEEKRRWYTIDHAVPRSRGGNNDLDNLLPACNDCNGRKCDMTVEEYRRYLIMRLNDVPYFSKTQLEYLVSIGVDILAGLSYEFWFERQGKR